MPASKSVFNWIVNVVPVGLKGEGRTRGGRGRVLEGKKA